MNKEIALKNLILLDEVFRKHNVNYWLTDGTLLGLVRESDFIGHDLDTDIGIRWETFTPNILKEILTLGFSVKHYFGYPDDSFEIALIKDGVKTDLFFFYDRQFAEEQYHCAFDNIVERIDYVYKQFKTIEHPFLGHSFLIPENPVNILCTKYGSDWQTPKPNWHWAYDPLNHVKTSIKINLAEQSAKINQWLQS